MTNFPPIRRAAVLGAGVMGAQIAAHLANAGVDCDLLDLDRDLAVRGLQRLTELKPSPLFEEAALFRIRPGGFDRDLARVAEADWVIEAIVEDLEAKRALWKRVEPHLRPGAVASTNTSGIPIAAIAAALGAEARRAFMGTHFFNPPRYMRLLELIPGPETDPQLLERIRQFAERRLGKGVVVAHDTPNFIANRLGTYATQVTIAEMRARGLSVDAVDAITGPAMGHPKSATFRTLDLVGLDTYVHVAGNVRRQAADEDERRAFEVDPVVLAMVERGWLGEKAGQGFYRRRKDASGATVIETLDLDTMEYRPQEKPRFASVGAALKAEDAVARARALLGGGDEAAAFAWAVTRRLLAYAARRLPEIAGDVASVDRAMRWGFNWELGPFELWDALGFEETAARMEAEGERLPDWIAAMRAQGATSFYRTAADGSRECYYPGRGYGPLPGGPGFPAPAVLRRERAVWRAPDATLVDLGEGVAALFLHGAKDAIGPETAALYHRALDEAERDWRGLVLAATGENFCVGANLMLILMAAQAGAWDQVERAVRELQGVNQRAKRFPKPVVAAVHGLVLGGGAELLMAAPAAQAAAESYIGLVEVGAGVIPAGGGVKERWVRALAGVPAGAALDLNPLVQWVFETIALARVSTSAAEARQLGYLRPEDGVSMSRERLLEDARRRVVFLDEQGWVPRATPPVPVAGREGKAQILLAVDEMWRGGRISDHDRLIARRLAHVLCGGDVPAGTLVTEERILELEREAFLSLCGEPKTQERMRHLLQTGKPLRN
ncbi:MAG: enoyl-CoA hydratase/isomerase family protein [Firmicutes bacterium]|nr:enoyl-CoA hydratase/isomerase family protein [Bacillota bacterium]